MKAGAENIRDIEAFINTGAELAQAPFRFESGRVAGVIELGK